MVAWNAGLKLLQLLETRKFTKKKKKLLYDHRAWQEDQEPSTRIEPVILM